MWKEVKLSELRIGVCLCKKNKKKKKKQKMGGYLGQGLWFQSLKKP